MHSALGHISCGAGNYYATAVYLVISADYIAIIIIIITVPMTSFW